MSDTDPAAAHPTLTAICDECGQGLEPLEAFVAMEDDAASSLVSDVDSDLGALKKVLYGTGLLTPAIQSTAGALLAGEVPAPWERRWDGGPEKVQACGNCAFPSTPHQSRHSGGGGRYAAAIGRRPDECLH